MTNDHQLARCHNFTKKNVKHHFPPIRQEVAQKVSFFFPSSSVSCVSSTSFGATAGSAPPGRYGDRSGRGTVSRRRKPRASSRSRGARSQGATAQRRQVKNNRGTSKMMKRRLESVFFFFTVVAGLKKHNSHQNKTDKNMVIIEIKGK